MWGKFQCENPELKKQFGCVMGLFRTFQRQLLLTGHKSHSSGHAILTAADGGADHGDAASEEGPCRGLNVNQMVSMESSRASFSSSSCSTFSSPECSKSTQHEALAFERTVFPDKTSMDSRKPKTTNPDGGRPLDFRDIVKDSINGDSQCLSARASSREDVENHVRELVGLPRPMRPPKSMESSEQIDIDESLRVLFKLQETPMWSFSSYGESPRTSFEAKARRLSFDGQEISRKSPDSIENGKPTSGLQEPPRPSLDGKESSLEAKPNLSSKCSTSVVAKLMGLDAMPRLSTLTQGPVYNGRVDDSPFAGHRLKPLTSSSQGNKHYSKMKPMSNSRVPIEPAPWRQKVKHRVPHKAPVIDREAHVPEFVYSEIERKLRELGLGQSNRDLRALKQILDAMHEKGILDAKKDERKTTRSNQTLESPIIIMKPANSVKRSGVQPTSVIPMKSVSGIRKLETHATMDKRKATANHRVEQGQTFSARLKELSNKKTGNTMGENGSHIAACRPQQSPSEDVRSSLKTSGSVSPKLVQKRLEVESSQPPLPCSNWSNSQRHSSDRKHLESATPMSKLRHKPAIPQNRGEPLIKGSKTRNFTRQCDENPQSSETNSSLLSQMGIDVLHQESRCRSGRAGSIKKQKKPSTRLKGKVSSMEFKTATPEQPSPVPVLVASFSQDDLPPSTLKESSNFSHGDMNRTEQSSCKISQKLQSIEKLVQKLNELSSTDDKLSTTDHIASLCENRDPNHRYISEILLASGLLFKDLSTGPAGPMPIQLQPSGHPINPDLFHVLEQTKPKPKTEQEMLNRKLLFDVVNGFLIKKLELTSSDRRRFPSGQQLLKELCLEIDQLHAEASGGENYDNEIMISARWMNFEKELPKLVLDIERSIFKDLIDDIVSGEDLFASESKSSSGRRQLLST